MGYMSIEEHSDSLLHLKRTPGIRSWSLLVGIASVGVAAAYYSSDSILWKLFYVTGCVFVAMQNMEDWEEAVFDKTKNLIELKSFSLYTLVLTLWRKGHEKVVLDLAQLCDVCVQEEKVRYLGKGYLLMLRLAAGFSYPLTQSATLGGRSGSAVEQMPRRPIAPAINGSNPAPAMMPPGVWADSGRCQLTSQPLPRHP
ncbi:cytochrome b-245 chaperone 1 homolog isoform X2 [Antennarius striatus]|uniref:cytochrome b-245 chaperone 1 homolog isoform X2 n=1 Tax=Antennarius striatus TaxID=241820 RepID=UPI0035B2F3E7